MAGKFLDMTRIGIFEFITIVIISSIGAIIIEISKYLKLRKEPIEA